MVTLLILSLAFTIMVSFLCSLSEASFYSVPGDYVEGLIREGRPAGPVLKKLRHNVQKPISAILIVNTIANSSGGIVAGASAAYVFGEGNVAAFSIIFCSVLLIFSEIIPKTLGVSYSRKLSVWTARPLQLLVWLLTPLVWICLSITRIILRGKRQEHTISAEELVVMARLGHEHGVIDEHEVSVIENILDLADETVRSIMTPRPGMTMLSAETTVAEARSLGRLVTHARIPVHGDESSETIGVVFRRQILSEIAQDRPLTTVEELMKPVHFISEKSSLDELLRRFLESRQQLFIVLDEQGKEIGMVTLEDVIEEILGKEITEPRGATGQLIGPAA
jgi:CBS domain containing-hemolysin-like protein